MAESSCFHDIGRRRLFFYERPGTGEEPDLGREVGGGEDGSGGDAFRQHGPRVQEAKVPPDDTRASPDRAGLSARRPEGGPHGGRARRRHGRRERGGGRRLGGDEVGAEVGPWWGAGTAGVASEREEEAAAGVEGSGSGHGGGGLGSCSAGDCGVKGQILFGRRGKRRRGPRVSVALALKMNETCNFFLTKELNASWTSKLINVCRIVP